MNTRVLYVLMWKHALGRLRRPFQTIADIMCPVLCFLLLSLLHVFKDSDHESTKGNMINTEIIPIEDIQPRPHWLMYTPESPLTNSLMDDVGAKLKLKRLSSNPDFKERGYFPLPNGTRLLDIATKMKTTQALLIFDDLSGETWPARMKYTIRMKGDFDNEKAEKKNKAKMLGTQKEEPTRPQKQFFSEYGTFMVIQWAVDTSYIKLSTGADVPQNLSLQRFPYYNYSSRFFIRKACQILAVMCCFSLTLTFVFLASRLMEERISGKQELIKVMGVSHNDLWLSHLLNVLPIGVIVAVVGTVVCKVTAEPFLPETNGFFVFLMLFLYFNSVMAWAFLFSYISNDAQHAIMISELAYFCSLFTASILASQTMPVEWRLLTGLLPHVPMNWFWVEVSAMEFSGRRVNFRNMNQRHTLIKVPPILIDYLFMLLQSLICYVITWYLSLVRPGQYGQALPWNFLVKREYWSNHGEEPDEVEEDHTPRDKRYFEPGPPHTEAGIKVVNVSKVYPEHKVLNNVSLEVYKGEITVLLGHNGAGKTTLMSIITGMTNATEGKVFVNGKDSVKLKSEVRKNLGHCPQHNLFFDDLTVQEHIMFFTMLKRSSYSEASQSAKQLAEQLGISDKLKSMPSDLSGGMKRRAQLACALAGGADVLVLDEPTSGLDVETRRELWDLLLSLRGERTVLLTTHFMEEADALGDRVAALSGGVLKGFATPMHLKKAVGTGYRLSLTTIGIPNEAIITKTVKSHVPDATLGEQTNSSLSYNLPAAHSGRFSTLFSDLETNRSKLGINSIGVGVSTLEEVFLKLCTDIDTAALYEEEAKYNDNVREPELPPDKLKGISLYVRQLYVLLKRLVKYARHRGSVILSILLLSIGVICIITDISNDNKKGELQDLVMTLDRFKLPNFVLYRLEGPYVTPADVEKLQLTWYYKATFLQSGDVAKTLLEMSKRKTYKYELHVAGVEVDYNGFKVLSSTTRRHTTPVALNLLSNMLAVHYIPSSDGNSIITISDPILREINAASIKEPKNIMSILMWGVAVILVILIASVDFTALPCKERRTGARQIHIMSGCPVQLHWLAMLSFHMVCALVVIIGAMLAGYYLDKENTFNQPDMLGSFALILFLGCMAHFTFGYLMSLHFDATTCKIFFIFYPVIFVVMTAPMKTLFDVTGQDEKLNINKAVETYILIIISYIATPHTIAENALKCLLLGRMNLLCELNKERCPTLHIDSPAFDAKKCCAGEKPRCYFCIDKWSPVLGMIILLVHFLVLMEKVHMKEKNKKVAVKPRRTASVE